MGWAVGWDPVHRRHRGYGVPAYCDAFAKGCRQEIDRGLGYVAQPEPPDGLTDEEHDEFSAERFDDTADGVFFVCSEHGHEDVNPDDLPPEHPTWLNHVLTDGTWERWRTENPELVVAFRAALTTKENENA